MAKRTLIIAQNIGKDLIEQVRQVVPDWNIIVGRDQAVWLDELPNAEIIAGWKQEMAKHCLHPQTRLRWIQSWSAGVDSYPIEELGKQNILLTSANGVHAYPISETILALMLALTRKIHTYVKNQQTKTWHHAHLNLEMHGKTVGIIGVGAIGKETAKLAKAFGMKVIGVRQSGRPESCVDQMVTSDKLNEILPECDYVVVTLPLTEATRHLFGHEQFRRMKSSGFFINIGRGPVVEESALIEALRSGSIAGAGLDVFEKEPLEPESPLWDMDDVIITPHTAGSTEYYDQRVIEDIFMPNLKKYISGESPDVNLVDYEKGY
ncbi:MAG: D-2-hydroxyacid dehydrogenase [Tuberibacillus sp.]